MTNSIISHNYIHKLYMHKIKEHVWSSGPCVSACDLHKGCWENEGKTGHIYVRRDQGQERAVHIIMCLKYKIPAVFICLN